MNPFQSQAGLLQSLERVAIEVELNNLRHKGRCPPKGEDPAMQTLWNRMIGFLGDLTKGVYARQPEVDSTRLPSKRKQQRASELPKKRQQRTPRKKVLEERKPSKASSTKRAETPRSNNG